MFTGGRPKSHRTLSKLVPWFADSEADRAQMQLLFAELKRIEGQQQMLKSAVAQNKMLVVLPPAGFNAESVEDEYAEEIVVKPEPDRFVPSGGFMLDGKTLENIVPEFILLCAICCQRATFAIQATPLLPLLPLTLFPPTCISVHTPMLYAVYTLHIGD